MQYALCRVHICAQNVSIGSLESAGSNASPTAENACVSRFCASPQVDTMTRVGSAIPKRATAAIVAGKTPVET